MPAAPLSPADEAALVARCQAGDDAAWAALYRLYAPAVVRFVARLVGPEGDVDDVVQQVFVRCFASLRRFRGEAQLTTWLYRVAAHVAASARRSDSRRRRRHDALQAEAAPAGAPDVHDTVAARRTLHVLDQVLETLSPKLRVVWVMVEAEGLSPEEAAGVLGLRQVTARTRLHKARQKVTAALARLERPSAHLVALPATGQRGG